MKKNLFCLPFILALAFSAAGFSAANAQQAKQKQLWQIGRPDSGMQAYALAPGHWRQFAKDGFFVVGKSHEATDWPYVHPGPDDAWAGSRQHTFSILFGCKNKPGGDSCILTVKLADIGWERVTVAVKVNGHPYTVKLPQGSGNAIDGDAGKGKAYLFKVTFAANLLAKGVNTVSLTTEEGSWFLYDWVGLEGPSGIRLQGVPASVALTDARALPFISIRNGRECQPVDLFFANTADSTDVTVDIKGLPPQQAGVAGGAQQVEIFAPAVTRDSSVDIAIEKGGKVIDRKTVMLHPVVKMTIYVLPHSHNDLGYTEIQTKVEKKQINNLLIGMEYARKTRDYPEGARFVWNMEGMYAADLFLQRMNEQQKAEFYDAVGRGEVALNGMYFNTLTGLCKPEELLQLFAFGATVSQKTKIPIDAAMISDVPGYTWGTVAAMAQAGIKYFSVAPNYFDRIGDILQKWEDKPFYWVSPSGKEKVLVWIPYKGYALSHGMPEGPSAGFVSAYMDRLKGKNYPYDISYIRWSGHGDNAVPDLQISDFVKDWSSKYDWPKFIISSTSTAFHAFEEKYGDRLPIEKGDWTGYWEDGAGSSAFETAENRASSARLTQAEALWAMLRPDGFPAAQFNSAWQHVLLYDEHTWGADVSVDDPLSQKTKEQWAIKKSYADSAGRLSEILLDQAITLGALTPAAPAPGNAAPAAIDVFNTSSWQRTNLVLVSAALSAAGDRVKDEQGQIIPAQRLSTGELAFIAEGVPPYAAKRFFIVKGKADNKDEVQTGENTLDNGIVRVTVDETTGGIKSLRAGAIDNEFADTTDGNYLNDYLFLEGKNLADLKRNGPVKISVKEKGPVLSTLIVESDAPGCNKLTREIQLVKGSDYVFITNILDKKPAELDPNHGDYAWANIHGKESLNIGFPFHVAEGAVRLDIPLAIMQPEKDQIPGACKNWLEVGGWADVSNKDYGITLATLDAPLIQVGGITATLLGGQSNPDVWRKKIGPTQKLYSWALNNHWETNYRASQEGIITFRYALRPHTVFAPVAATRFSTELSQPLIVTKALPHDYPIPRLQLSSDQLVVITLKPSKDGKAWMVTLFNPSAAPQRSTLQWSSPVTATSYSNTGEVPLRPVNGEVEVAGLDVVTLRVEKGDTQTFNGQASGRQALAHAILTDSRLDTIQQRAMRLLTGFAAGTSYGEVWIRDFNTFIKGSLQVQPKEKVRAILLLFFKLQGDDGNIVDGFIDKTRANGGYQYRYSALAPGWAAHKNTVETDQESSLVQAVKKYIDVTGDTSILREEIGGQTVLRRMESAMTYLLKQRWSDRYGLVTGATTIDWGDVQPEKGWGVAINDKTKWAIDIYDNAMYVMAIRDFLAMKPAGYLSSRDWEKVADGIRRNVRKYLWASSAQKYLPHIYLNGSPFDKDFDENKILYTGGSACAILAGFNSEAEIAAINRQMGAAAAREKHATIGMTVYPPYPAREFPNMKPYVYQNGGDWTWFGGRMVQALIRHGMVKEAYAELDPMINRALANNGFFEWYDVQTGAPKGSGDFRGEAGVLYDAITLLRDWAKAQ